jgi:asparagine synthase (glutamine-hydrolysing)
MPQYMVADLASQNVKVVLTGHGGDELYAGYQVNKVALIKETLERRPSKMCSVLLGIRRDEWTRVLYYLLYPLIYPEIRYGLYIMIPKRKRSSFLTPEFLRENLGFEPFESLNDFINGKDYSPGQQLLALYLKTYLPTLFLQEDKMSMAHSVEGRTPLCDNHLVDLALKFPLETKLWNYELKALTKAAMRLRLPDLLYALPKRGFPTPFAIWYRSDPVKALMKDLLFGKQAKERGLFNTARIERIFEANMRSKTDSLYDYARASILYSLALVELWFRTFMDTREPGPAC